MSTKSPIFYDEDTDTELFQRVGVGDEEVPVYLEITDPLECSVTQTEGRLRATLGLDAGVMDRLAIAWCIHRKLHGALGGPVGRELGSPDCEYD